MVLSSRHPRILLYCHNSTGLGHLARTCAIARAIHHKTTDIDLLILTGARKILSEFIPDGIDYVKLPAVQTENVPSPRAAYLSLPIEEMNVFRQSIIASVLRGFKPDIFVVDHNPAGLAGELEGILDSMHDFLPTCRRVLGIRGVMYKTYGAEEYFAKHRYLLETHYDRILVYIDPQVLDLTQTSTLPPEIVNKMVNVGYISRNIYGNKQPANSNAIKHILVAAGSGSTGYALLKHVIDTIPYLANKNVHFDIITGPYLPPSHYETIASQVEQLQIPTTIQLDYQHTNPSELLKDADLFIGRGGYNTLVDLIASKCPAIIIPYEGEHSDQLLHAQLLAKYLDLTVVSERNLEPPETANIIKRLLYSERLPTPSIDIDLNGAERAANMILEMI